MKSRLTILVAALAAVLLGLRSQSPAEEKPALKQKGKKVLKTLLKNPLAWTLDEAKEELALNPRDAYLQYAVLQLSRRENQLQPNAEWVDRLVNPEPWRRNDRRNQVDLFSIFTGALAVQESLQLDTMRGETPRRGAPPVPVVKPVDGQDAKQLERARREAEEKHKKELVDVASLTGPTIKSHPWAEMLGDKKPEISPLARHVPDDYYLADFRSLNKLIDAMGLSDLWGTHLFNQAVREARTQLVGERLKKQLVVETNSLLRPFYDLVVQEVAVTGSDLFAREGSDVTLLFKVKQPDVFKGRMDGFLTNAENTRPDAKRTTGEFQGIPFVHLATADRELNVYSAYPAADLHVRSNSRVAFERVLQTFVKGKEGRTLGDSLEMAFIRTLMARGAKEEDGFIYLSDPFIRRLVGLQVKLTERRRMLCYNYLRMIGHAALLYRTETGKVPASLEDLAKARCIPGTFGEGPLTCPDGGTYALAADGSAGVCSHHGHAQLLTPCCEVPLDKVTREEADEYKAFLQEYNQYWRTYFDPIGIRIQITPERYRLETIVLPLIDNSIYSGLAMALGGKPEPLDSLPVPKRNIFSVALRFNKEELIQQAAGMERELKRDFLRELGIRDQEARNLNVTEFLDKGLGSQVGLHVYDAAPTFDFNLPGFLGETMGTFSGRGMGRDPSMLLGSFLVASLNSPVYLSIPVQDEKVVDRFLEGLEGLFAVMARQPASGGWFSFEQDFYQLKGNKGQVIRCNGLKFGPVRFRIFWARIGKGLYIASKPYILDDLLAADKGEAAADRGPPAHAMVRMRPENWDQVLTDFRLGWAENNRQACLNNLGPLASVGRAVNASFATDVKDDAEAAVKRAAEIHRQADRLHGVHFFCPEGGQYVLGPNGKVMACSVHGWARAPRQAAAPTESAALGKLLRQFAGMTTTLTFLEDGLHAVVTIDRK